MKSFKTEDLQFQHLKFGRVRGALRLTHLPTGLFVESSLHSEPIVQVQKTLTDHLRSKVLTDIGPTGIDR